jgi:hypothetical protein
MFYSKDIIENIVAKGEVFYECNFFLNKNKNWCLHKNPIMSIQTWALNHIDDVFYFQDVGEINEIEV